MSSKTGTEIVRVPFYGDTIEAVQQGDDVWVGVKRGCENLGVDHDGQRKKLQNKPWARTEMISVRDSAGREQQTFMIHVKSVAMWLATIDVNKVKPELKEKLIRYQCECADALDRHFFGTSKSASGDYEGFVRMFMTVALPSMATTIATAVTSAVGELFRQSSNARLDSQTIGSRGKSFVSMRLKEYASLMAPDDKAAQKRVRAGAELDLRKKIGHLGTGCTLDRIPVDKWESVKDILEEFMRTTQRAGVSKQGNLF